MLPAQYQHSIIDPHQLLSAIMVLVCVLCAGLAAGLTIGLVSIDKNELNLILINGTFEEKQQAKAVLPILKDHHWLLVTLFLFNATANEALPLFLGDLVPKFWSVIIATFAVLIFGEIIPSSVFSGKNQLKLAASMSPVVYALLIMFYPVARPIGLFLDHWLGKHEEHEKAPFNAKDLYTLLSMARAGDDARGERGGLLGIPSSNRSYGTASRMGSRMNSFHEEGNKIEGAIGGELFHDLVEHQAPTLLHSRDEHDDNLLDHDTVTIAQGAIVCSKIKVDRICQPSFYTVEADRPVNMDFLEEIGRCGHSRIPVVHGRELLGYLVCKELLCRISYYSKLGAPGKPTVLVRHLNIHDIKYYSPDVSVLAALNMMQVGMNRIGVVTRDGTSQSEVLGYFTLEDVMEEIIGEEIDDEKDSKRKQRFKSAIQSTGYSYIHL